MRLHLMLPTIAFFFATLYTTMAGPPHHGKDPAQREQDVAEFAKLLAKNDIADLPAYFSFWRSGSSASLEFARVKAPQQSTFRVARVIYPVPGRGDRSHSFIFADDTHCVLHTPDTPGLLNSGFVDLTGDGQTEKVAVFPIDADNDDGVVSDIGKHRLRAWSFTGDRPTLILDAVFTPWEPGDGNRYIDVSLVPPTAVAPFSISLKANNGKSYGRFHWSKEQRKIVHDGLDDKKCRVRKLDSASVGRCSIHPDVEVTRGKGCPVCGMRLPE